MLNFYFNGYDFFQYLKDGKWPDGMEHDGTIIPGLPAVENEVSIVLPFSGRFFINLKVYFLFYLL